MTTRSPSSSHATGQVGPATDGPEQEGAAVPDEHPESRRPPRRRTGSSDPGERRDGRGGDHRIAARRATSEAATAASGVIALLPRRSTRSTMAAAPSTAAPAAAPELKTRPHHLEAEQHARQQPEGGVRREGVPIEEDARPLAVGALRAGTHHPDRHRAPSEPDVHPDPQRPSSAVSDNAVASAAPIARVPPISTASRAVVAGSNDQMALDASQTTTAAASAPAHRSTRRHRPPVTRIATALIASTAYTLTTTASVLSGSSYDHHVRNRYRGPVVSTTMAATASPNTTPRAPTRIGREPTGARRDAPGRRRPHVIASWLRTGAPSRRRVQPGTGTSQQSWATPTARRGAVPRHRRPHVAAGRGCRPWRRAAGR